MLFIFGAVALLGGIFFAFYRDYVKTRPPKDIITSEQVTISPEKRAEVEKKLADSRTQATNEENDLTTRFRGWLNVGIYSESLGLFLPALEAYGEAAKLASDNMTPWINIGSLKRRMYDWRGSEEAFKKAIELRPTETEPYYRLAELYVDYPGKSAEDVRRVYENMRSRFGDLFEITVRYAEYVEQRQKNLAEALKLYERALELRPESEQIKKIIIELKGRIERQKAP